MFDGYSFIRFLCVQINNQHLLPEIFQFVKDNCAKHIICLQVNNYWLVNVSQIAEQLKHVKALELNHMALNVNIYDTFLKYCEQLQILVIFPLINDQDGLRYRIDTTWTSLKYLQLETFIYVDCSYKEMDFDFSDFLRNHPKLKTVVTDQKSLIRSLCSTEFALPYAAMIFDSEDDLLDIWHTFQLCLKHRDLSYKTLKNIFRYKQIKAIHWVIADNDHRELLRDLSAQPHIEKLCLSFIARLNKDLIPPIVESFPCLQKLIQYMNRHTANSFKGDFIASNQSNWNIATCVY